MNWFVDRMSKGHEILVLPGAYDALSARLIAEADAEAVYCGGFAATASQYALPDLGLLGLGEMCDIYRRVKSAGNGLPLIVDGDTGHGGLLNVQRMTEQLSDAGVDAFHIEDQVMPKRCGHLAGKDVVSRREAVARVRAAIDAAGISGPAIIARTDAIAVNGFDDAIDRAKAFLDVGATAVMLDAPTSLKQIEAIPGRVPGPVIFNAAPTGTGPWVDNNMLSEYGYSCVIHPIECILAAANETRKIVKKLLSCPDRDDSWIDFKAINKILRAHNFLEKEKFLADGR